MPHTCSPCRIRTVCIEFTALVASSVAYKPLYQAIEALGMNKLSSIGLASGVLQHSGRMSVVSELRADQVWLEDFMAKEKEVSGVKDEPKEGSPEGRDDSEASRQPSKNGFSKAELKARKGADAEPAGDELEATAAAGEGRFCME